MTHTLLVASSLLGPLAAPAGAAAHAAGTSQPDAARIALGIRKLGVVGSVLYVAAHPDDENTALLAYLANGALVRTAYLSVTRGDGGQNLIGAEQGPELGVIRTEELLAARRIDGAEQFFTRARDFGYSKSPEESLRIWGKDAVLADVVTVIRRFRPDVIVTRFSPEPSDTHGHHTASAMLAVEAFRAAADPRFHPDELAHGLQPWQARRLYWNRSSWNLKPSDDMSGFIKLDVGGYSPLLGTSFGEMAADSRSMHKSQGFGVARRRDPNLESFKLLLEAAPAGKGPASKTGARSSAPQGLLGGIDFTWARFPETARLGGLVDAAAKRYDPAAPHASLPALAAIGAAVDRCPDAGWRAEKQRQLGELMLACAGVFAEATAPEAAVAPGGEIEVTATALDRSPARVTLEEVAFPWGGGPTRAGQQLPIPPGHGAAEAVTVKRTARVPADASPTTPYWLDAPPDGDGLYHVADAARVGRPESPSTAEVAFTFSVAGRRIVAARSVAFKWTDPVAGERTRPLEVTPVVSVRPDTALLMFPGDVSRPVIVKLTAGAPGVSGRVRPEAPAGWVVEPSAAPFALAGKGSEVSLTFQVRPPPGGKGAPGRAKAGALRFFIDVGGGARLARGVVRIVHDHIPIQTLLVDANVNVVPLALATGGTRIGYFPGPGDEVPASLRRVGYDVSLLGEDALATGGAALARWDAIVIGVRAFNTSERLRGAHALLMSYVEGGGVLVVQYNTNNRIAPLTAPLGPWPFDISGKRVTDEAAPVAFAPPTHPALTTPNRIDGHDFEGWVQERGLYFADRWDPRYETPLAMHDPGEPPLPGGLLWARHGKGVFVYTGLAFFRQLPAGVPGAYRLFANLLAGGLSRRGR